MIKIEHVVLASPAQMEFIIEGMRNAKNSWALSDSYKIELVNPDTLQSADFEYFVGDKDLQLMGSLSVSGSDHRKYMRMMPVMVRITAPLYWWKEFDTYKIGTVSNSCSTMHKVMDRDKFILDDFSCELLQEWSSADRVDSLVMSSQCFDVMSGMTDSCVIMPKDILLVVIDALNHYLYWWKNTDKNDVKTREIIWNQVIQLLPTSFNQTRNIEMNYEVLAQIYHSRYGHKLAEWRELCRWIKTLPYREIITSGAVDINKLTEDIRRWD